MVAHPIERTITDYQVFTARTQAVQSVEIKARVTGYLTKILFKDGDLVKEGEVLFQIDDRPYKAALDQAKANLELARAALVKTQAEYDIGLAVQKQEAGAISQQELTRRLGARDQAKANVDVARANIEEAQLNFGWCQVTSPINGRANTHFVDVGNLVSQNVTVLTNIVSLKPMWAYFDVDENTVLKLEQLIAEGKIESARDRNVPIAMGLANDAGFPWQGTIDFISNQLDPNTGSIRVRAVFPTERGELASGLFGRIRVPIGAAHPALLVSERAVGTDQGEKFLLLVNDQNEVEYRAVDVGQSRDGLREIHRRRILTEPGPGGKDIQKDVEVLSARDRVIVDGLQRVRPGAKVEPKLVDMLTWMSRSSEKSASKPAIAKPAASKSAPPKAATIQSAAKPAPAQPRLAKPEYPKPANPRP